MDSRRKIVSGEEAAAAAARLRDEGRKVCILTGYFDPLLAVHAEELEKAVADGSALMVVVGSPADPLLPERARAELVAGLRSTDYVVAAQGEAAEQIAARIPHDSLQHQEAEDDRRRAELILHVQHRCQQQ